MGDIQDLYAEYSRAILSGTASLFVGAGVSQGAGFPGWHDMLGKLRHQANEPVSLTDAPLAAEYIKHELGSDAIVDGLLSSLNVETRPTQTHALINDLGVKNIWTTNYDCLLEGSLTNRFVINNDSAYSQVSRVQRRKRLVKLHGSLGRDANDMLCWTVPPIITRSDYEEYASSHPLMWADLTASFLTSTFLFVGFSFTDPNIDLLLRLGRALSPKVRRSPHYAIFRRELGTSTAEQRLAELRRLDLERSGIRVTLVDEFSDIDEVLLELRRRLLPPNLFVAGGGLSAAEMELVEELGHELGLASATWSLVSLGSKPAKRMAVGFKRAMKEQNRYDPERARFYYRAAPQEGHSVPRLEERVGTVIYTEQVVDRMRDSVVRQAQVLALFGGGERAIDEVKTAMSAGLLVIPFGPEATSIVRTVREMSGNRRLLTSHLELGVPRFKEESFALKKTAARMISYMSSRSSHFGRELG